MLTFHPNPVLVSFFGFEIRYYGLFYLIGFLIVYLMYSRLSKRLESLNHSKDKAFEMLFWGLVGGIIVARIFYVFFYDFAYYSSHLIESLFLWQGGLSFHGGLVGAVLAVYLFCRHNSISFLEVADVLVIPASLALALGRLGNLLNGELYGRVSNVPWAVIFTMDPELKPRHPSQIYESLKNVAIFVILYLFFKTKYLLMGAKKRKGLLLTFFILLYGSFRFLVEFFRAPDPQLGLLWLGLSLGQWLSLIMVFFALFFLFVKLKKPNPARPTH